jgi:chromosome partitioning protein
MKIVTFAHQKGGVGKSTLTINMAYYLRSIGKDVGVVDMDYQGSSWSCIKDIPVYRKGEILKEHDYILIDTPPYNSSELQELFEDSDIVVIPTKAGLVDLIAISGTIKIFEKARLRKKNLHGYVVFNMIDQRNTIFEEIKPKFEELGLPVMQNNIHHRASFIRSVTEQNGIFSLKDKIAQDEIVNLTQEIINYVTQI